MLVKVYPDNPKPNSGTCAQKGVAARTLPQGPRGTERKCVPLQVSRDWEEPGVSEREASVTCILVAHKAPARSRGPDQGDCVRMVVKAGARLAKGAKD